LPLKLPHSQFHNGISQLNQKHTKRFRSVVEAERHLNFLRVQTDSGDYDELDYQKAQPLSFKTLREKYVLARSRDQISQKTIHDTEVVLKRVGGFKDMMSGKKWDDMNIKDITEAEIDDFFQADHDHRGNGPAGKETKQVSNKTLDNWKNLLFRFWTWVVRREKHKSRLVMPEFPTITYKLKRKKLVRIGDQQAIMDELKRITWDRNPRVWLAVRLMAWYPRIRPGEMVRVLEGDINITDGYVLCRNPKEGDDKTVHLLPEHIEIIREIWGMAPKSIGMERVLFFRHLKSWGKAKAGAKFQPGYLNRWWKKSCTNLGIEGVSVYPGVKHSTVTALGANGMQKADIQQFVTGHTSRSFNRYFLPGRDQDLFASRKVAEMQNQADQPVTNLFGSSKSAK
jgi:integrase